MRRKGIPDSIKKQVEEIVTRFNKEVIKDPDQFYVPRYRGRYLYLDRKDFGTLGQVCRLGFNGKIDNWDFAIFKYSTERYDDDEWFFPGSQLVDGTV